jgi:putative N6-adenine-specific DNA methylase
MEPREVSSEGVGFSGTIAEVARANLWLRTASRILVRFGAFHARTFAELERNAARLDWANFISDGRAAFRVTARKSRLFHTAAIAERLARAAKVELVAPDAAAGVQLFIVRGVRDKWALSADSSGSHLHLRGYRQAVGKAPLRENLAAAMILASGWDSTSPLVDPFCGSGTILIEAALIAEDVPPGLNRDFAFLRWPKYNKSGWDRLLSEAREKTRKEAAVVLGYDRDAGAVVSAQANAERAGLASSVNFEQQAISDFHPPESRGWIVTNPPYGVRVGDRRALRDLYARFGAVLRERCSGWRLAILSAAPELENALRLELQEIFRTTNGGIRVRLMVADIQ